MIKPPDTVTLPATPTGKAVAAAMAGITASSETARKV